MDKVKQTLTFLRKYHFWILCVLVALIGLVLWNSAVGKLDAEFKRDAANIDQTLNGLKQIQTPHPNDTWTDGFGKLTDALRQEVAATWNELYKQQKQEIFVWPQSLGKEFLDAVAAAEKNPEEKLSDKLRERYQNRVRHESARLAEIVDAAPVDETGRSAARPTGEDMEGDRHRVRWGQLADIQSSFDTDQPPSTQMIFLMQEELWVYEALCKVIKAVNEGSTGPHDASISAIDEMLIAYPASDNVTAGGKRIVRHKSAGGGPDAGVVLSGGEGAAKKPDFKSRGKDEDKQTGEEGGGGDPDTVWKNFRYVKETGEPLMAGDLAGASPEFNLMPFRLELAINPRDLDRLLVALRNSVLPIEVREVRINPGAGLAAAISGSGAAKPTDIASLAERTHRSERVEISGVVYLVKPFKPEALGIAPAAESGGESGEGAAMPTGEAPAGAAKPPAETPPVETPAEAPKGG